jgi:probable phosphoglycerate mutase
MTETTSILLVRHGESTGNAERRWQGWLDTTLSELGEAQARDAASLVGAVDAIFASTLERAWRTAEIIAETLGIGPVERVEDLRERDLGAWTGLTTDEIKARWPGAVEIGADPEGGEAREHVVERAAGALLDIAQRYPGAQVLAVSHGGVIRFLERALGLDPAPIRNLGGRRFEVRDNKLALGEPLRLIDPTHVPSTEPRTL